MIHEIGLALSGIQDADVLVSMTTDTGYNAYEVFYLMYFIWRDGQEIINGRAEKQSILILKFLFVWVKGNDCI